GINGVGIARDAAGRGLSVLLVEKDDLGQGTSSRSGKLVHGGLRYLEYYEFRLVREALIEREVLLNIAPHIIWPMRFVLPHSAEQRPAWLIRAGLFLYDHLGGRKRLPGTRALKLSQCLEGEAIKSQYKKAFEYSDCWVDDARLVVLNAIDAAEKGAVIKSRTTFKHAKRVDDTWQVQIATGGSDTSTYISAKCLVNAAGPWVNGVINDVADINTKRRVRLVKGSHIVVKKFWTGNQAYLIQNIDKRVIFINPYEKDMALIGTTDVPYEGDPGLVQIDDAEIEYLLAAVNLYFKNKLNRDDISQSFSGVRALYDDNSENPSAVTRDYLFDIDVGPNGTAAFLSIFGGKITTFRKLAEHSLDKLNGIFPNMGRQWTANSALPGGDIAEADFNAFIENLCQDYPELPSGLIEHYSRLYGSRTNSLLGTVNSTAELGVKFSECFYEIEARYLIEKEWAQTPEDILTRRTKHYLHMSDNEVLEFHRWFENEFDPVSKCLKAAS
ncbi:UNVERIFIED_CONTAM: hypothetical protein GTU68_052262, partial [Idotea baltica]|nr:hypothetical protein [Idotea baltica]